MAEGKGALDPIAQLVFDGPADETPPTPWAPKKANPFKWMTQVS